MGSASTHKKARNISDDVWNVIYKLLLYYMKGYKSILQCDGVISRCINNFYGCWITSFTTSFILNEQPESKIAGWLASRQLDFLGLNTHIFYTQLKFKNT